LRVRVSGYPGGVCPVGTAPWVKTVTSQASEEGRKEIGMDRFEELFRSGRINLLWWKHGTAGSWR
jgi:hypothetical protein